MQASSTKYGTHKCSSFYSVTKQKGAKLFVYPYDPTSQVNFAKHLTE